MLLFLTFLAYKSLQLRGGHFVCLSRLNENRRVITRTNFLAMRREKHCTNLLGLAQAVEPAEELLELPGLRPPRKLARRT